MSVDQLTNEILNLIIPALPYLIKGIKIGGKKAAEKFGEIGGEKAFGIASQLWNTINRKGKPSRKFSIAVKELSKDPNDKTWRKLMKDELKVTLQENHTLKEQLSNLLIDNIPEQTVRALRTKKAKISQATDSSGKQKVSTTDSSDLIIHQTVNKK